MTRYLQLLAALLMIAGCDASGPAAPASDASQAASAVVPAGDSRHELGRQVYNFRCYYCHGYSGNARTLAADMMAIKPRDFTHTSLQALPRERMLLSIRNGRPGTPMVGFANVLKPEEIEAVADFIRLEFMTEKRENTRYHTEANGWKDHQRYAKAYPFALGQIALDTPWEQLTPEQAEGKRLFMATCISCHDRAKVNNGALIWESNAVSYPRNQFKPGDNLGKPETWSQASQQVDGMTSATPYHIHDRAPQIAGLTESEKRGESLFQHNCAFCHAADGTGKNWIGSFLQPHPRDLTSKQAMAGMTRDRMRIVIRDGLPETSMPAWKAVFTAQQIDDVIAYVNRAFHPLPPEK